MGQRKCPKMMGKVKGAQMIKGKLPKRGPKALWDTLSTFLLGQKYNKSIISQV